jgi:hypothetical protein
MSLTQTIKNAVTSAFTAAGDALDDVRYYAVGVGTYDVDADAQVRTETLVLCPGLKYEEKIVIEEWKRTEMEQTKVLIEGKHFVAASVEPAEQDYMVIDGVKYEIKKIDPTPKKIAYIFTVRAV